MALAGYNESSRAAQYNMAHKKTLILNMTDNYDDTKANMNETKIEKNSSSLLR